MSFPLCSWLYKNTGRTIWLMGEERFYKELFRITPKNVYYIPLEAKDQLLKEDFNQIINLSNRPEVNTLVGQLNGINKIGIVEKNNQTKIHGMWQLYRASLTHNNHYNKFHWADLNALDSIPLQYLKEQEWQKPRQLNKGKIGLFIGASEKEKRFDALFWAELALSLAKKGYEPVFLGGPSQEEKDIANEAAKLATMPRASLAGRFTIIGLATFIQTLDLFVSPDTGPMHLAADQGIPTFNLSVGPVHPWETAPYPSHHYVLRSNISCSGCWRCTKETQLCRDAFIPSRIANLMHSYLQNKTLPHLPNLSLYKTGRTDEGLYQLENIFGSKQLPSIQSDFWRYFFADYFFQLQGQNTFVEKKERANQDFLIKLPKMHALLRRSHLSFLREVLQSNKKNAVLAHNSWKNYPPFMRPLTSFAQLLLENDNYSMQAKENVLHLLENFNSNLSV